MTKSVSAKHRDLLAEGQSYLQHSRPDQLTVKPAPNKWSKIEIFGHLIDSALNNLQRFTEIQFVPKPYPVRKYPQEELVIANNYQHADINELLVCWLALNHRILKIMEKQTADTLAFKALIGKDHMADFWFLYQDYVKHLEHHLKQIVG